MARIFLLRDGPQTRGVLHDCVVCEQDELHHEVYSAVGQIYPGMSRADLNCTKFL